MFYTHYFNRPSSHAQTTSTVLSQLLPSILCTTDRHVLKVLPSFSLILLNLGLTVPHQLLNCRLHGNTQTQIRTHTHTQPYVTREHYTIHTTLYTHSFPSAQMLTTLSGWLASRSSRRLASPGRMEECSRDTEMTGQTVKAKHTSSTLKTDVYFTLLKGTCTCDK